MGITGLIRNYPEAPIVTEWKHFPLDIRIPSAPQMLRESEIFSIGKFVWSLFAFVASLLWTVYFIAVSKKYLSIELAWAMGIVLIMTIGLIAFFLSNVSKCGLLKAALLRSGLESFTLATKCFAHQLGLSLEALFQGTKEELTELCQQKLTDLAERVLAAESLGDTAAKLIWKGSFATAHNCFMRSGFADESDWGKAFQRAEQKIKQTV
jgi:hypothetical protein